ncbi:formyltransferase family protein [Thermodesulfobacteriota bacterium]
MKVLLLSPEPSHLTETIMGSGCEVVPLNEKFDIFYLEWKKIDFIVSYRYRHIIGKPIIDWVKGKAVNLHISLLPWNRGADPNLWSFLQDTPKGVTIHYIDEGIDTGDIIAQEECHFDMENNTLATTYKKLNLRILSLFESWCSRILEGKAPRIRQKSEGTYHKSSDKNRYLHLLSEKGWDTPVKALIGKANG